jgi:hypothetical protein
MNTKNSKPATARVMSGLTFTFQKPRLATRIAGHIFPTQMKITKFSGMVLSVFAAVAVARADVNIQWNADSYSSFDVTITGTGLNSEGTITSPSGLWQLYFQIYGAYLPNYIPERPIDIGNAGQITFLGQIPPTLDPNPAPNDNIMQAIPYNDFFAPSVPIQDGTSWVHGGFILDPLGWQGWNPIVIISLPQLDDPTTWTWTAEYAATGPGLAPAPEPGTASLALVALLIWAVKAFRRRSDVRPAKS